jgi:ankyrin repeat protein
LQIEKKFKVVNVDIVCNGETALLHAIRRQDFRVTEFLLINGASVTKVAGTDISPLNLAIENRTKNLEILELLLMHGADVFEEDEYRDTILMTAVFRRDFELVNMFLNSEMTGARRGDICLAASCCIVSQVHVEEFLRRGVSPNNPEMSPLIFSCLHGDEAMVKILLEYGADTNIEDPRGGTPLSNAVCAGKQTELLKLLVAYGADPNRMTTGFDDPDVTGTPLMEAARMRDLPTVRGLLNLGADVNITNKQHRTALHYCSGWETYCPVIKSPLKRVTFGGGIYGTNRTAPLIVNALIEHGTDVRIKDVDGRTPFDVNLRTLRSMFNQTEVRLKASTQLLPVYLSMCERLLKAGAGFYENSRESFDRFLDVFLSCDYLDDIPSAEIFTDIVQLALVCGLKVTIGNYRSLVESKNIIKRKIGELITHFNKNCPTLKQRCRIQIRKNMLRPPNGIKDLQELPLPTLMKEYLLYADV